MTLGSSSRWTAVWGVVAIVVIVVASLIPAQWQLRTGLHWQLEHFLVYFVATSIFCITSSRPFVVAASLMLFAGLLEALQGLTPDRVPDLPTALSGAAGTLAAALIAWLGFRIWIGRCQTRKAAETRELAQAQEI
jgi:VanZ family protein